MFDEETEAEPKIVSASISDPYFLLLRDDASVYIAQCDDDNELEEVERVDDNFLTNKWLSGCLYNDTTGAFANAGTKVASNKVADVIMFLLNSEGALYVSQLVSRKEYR
jgi:cleavage and polyadenylation specificity factor subunit 1